MGMTFLSMGTTFLDTQAPPEHRPAKLEGQLPEQGPSRRLQDLRITVFHSFDEARQRWREAEEECTCYLFQTYEWLSVWNAEIGSQQGLEPLIVRVADGADKTLLILPLAVMRFSRCRVLVFMGDRVTDYNAPMLRAEPREQRATVAIRELWVEILRRLPKLDVIYLRRMPETVEGVPNPMLGLSGVRHTDDAHAATPLPTDFETFKKSRSSRFFADTRRKRRRLSEIGKVRFEIVSAREELADTVERMLAQKQRRSARDENREAATKEWIPDPGSQLKGAFFRAISCASFRFGAMHVSRLRVEAETVATHVGALYRNRFYWLMPGYEGEKWARYSAGRILLESLVEWCIENEVKTVDLTVGDEEYKRHWANGTMALYELRTALTWKGHLTFLWWRIVERARRDRRLRSIVLPLKRVIRNMGTGLRPARR